jgi:hypothetical protein
MRRTQKGIGFLGLVFLLVSIGVIGTIFMKVYPLYTNELKIKRAVTETIHRGEATSNAATFRSALQRWWDVDDIEFLPTKEVNIVSSGKGRTVSYDYYARADVFTDVSIIVHFKRDYPLQAAVGGAN